MSKYYIIISLFAASVTLGGGAAIASDVNLNKHVQPGLINQPGSITKGVNGDSNEMILPHGVTAGPFTSGAALTP